MKNKFIYLIFIISSVLVLSPTLSQTTFSKVVNGVNGNEYGIELMLHNNKYYTISKGVIHDTVSHTSITPDFMLIFDSVLQKENRYVFKNGFATKSKYLDKDTIYVFGIDRSKNPKEWNVYKFNLKGDSLDMLVYDEFDVEYMEAMEMGIKGDYLYLAGRTYTNTFRGAEEIRVLKMDKSGKVVKENRFYDFANPEHINVLRDMTQTADGNFVITNMYYGTGDSNDHIALCKFDENLDTIWTKDIHTTKRTYQHNNDPYITATPDSGVVVSTAIDIFDLIWNDPAYEYNMRYPLLFYKLDKEGNIMWTDTLHEYSDDGISYKYIKYVEKLYTAKNGDILVAGRTRDVVPGSSVIKAWLCRYSPDGKRKWHHTYIDSEYYANKSFFYDIKEAENGDIICVGGLYTDIGDDYNNDYTWLLRVDSNGCFTPDCILADTVTEVIVTSLNDLDVPIDMPRRVNIYPNPTLDHINISLPEDINWSKWSIYDIKGQKIRTGSIDDQLDFIISGFSNLQSGVYYIMVKGVKGRIGIGKFVVK